MHTNFFYVSHNIGTWIKKDSANMFDVTMGSFDGTATCELVGTYILSLLPDKLISNTDTPKYVENIKKTICNIFKANNLKMTIKDSMKIVNFLDVTLDLTKGSYGPYTKYINTIFLCT